MHLSNREHLVEGMVCIDCVDRTKLLFNTDEQIYAIVDELNAIEDEDELDRTERETGFNWNPDGILLDPWLRGIVKPVLNYIRDPMHTLVSSGQANTHTALLLRALKRNKISIDMVSEYAQSFTLPAKYGKVTVEWLSVKRVRSKDPSFFASYAATMLSLVPLVFAFLMDMVFTSPDAEHLHDHIRCYGLLASILGLLQRVDTAPANVGRLQTLIDEYCALFIGLYDRAKQKFHQMLHLHESIVRFNRVLSCFATERRHRITKKAALYVFRRLESTVVKDLINRMAESCCGHESLFKPTYLVRPQVTHVMHRALSHADNVVLACGGLKKGDILYCSSRGAACLVGRVERFWECNQIIVVRIASFRCTNNDHRYWNTDAPVSLFVESSKVVDAVAWRQHTANVIRIIPLFKV
jgi:hypothetical protein